MNGILQQDNKEELEKHKAYIFFSSPFHFALLVFVVHNRRFTSNHKHVDTFGFHWDTYAKVGLCL